ncbi:MAG: hypothetical protein PVI30_24315 [Myxococcales bacterium]|jgi:hypothetical protein
MRRKTDEIRSGSWFGLALAVALAGGCTGSEEMPSRDDSGGSYTPAVGGAAGNGGQVQIPTGSTGTPATGATGAGGALDGSGSGDPAAGAMTPVATDEGTPVPCDVADVVSSNCHTCHGPTPVGGAIRLVTHEDWHRTSPIYGPNTLGDPTKKVYEVAQVRLADGSMPQGATMADADLQALTAWLAGGATAGTAADASCAATTDPVVTDPGVVDPNDPKAGSECSGADAYEALVARGGETCYEFRVHGVSSPTDTSKFEVAPGESYHEFIYDVPWEPGTVATRFGADFDNVQVLHHWLAFDYTTTQPAGTVNRNVLGTTLGANAQLIGGWAVGGCNFVLPDDVGLQIPDSGHIMVQWHMYNTTGTPQPEGTAVQFCTMPPDGRPHTGGLTWLGTENFNGLLGMGAGMQEFHGTCINDSGAPITIIGFLPHLHTYGINMRSEVQRAGSSTWETVFDEPFDFNWQVHYMMEPPVVLQPNDRIKSTCTFFNDSGANVAFGESTDEEMCYQFAFSYPAGALDNGVLSLIGATNTCWQFGE